jgi:hypothetical protein
MRVIPSYRALLPASALVPLLLLAGCTDKVPPPAAPIVVTTSETPDSVQAIFTARCAKAGCHVTGTAAFDEVLEAGKSYAATVNVPSGERPAFMRIRPFVPDSSYLVKKIRGDAGIAGSRMPLDGPPFLSPADSSTVVNWVLNGAPATQVPVGPAARATAIR